MLKKIQTFFFKNKFGEQFFFKKKLKTNFFKEKLGEEKNLQKMLKKIVKKIVKFVFKIRKFKKKLEIFF